MGHMLSLAGTIGGSLKNGKKTKQAWVVHRKMSHTRLFGKVIALEVALDGLLPTNDAPMVIIPETGCKAIGSSDKVHGVDALAITGEEGRASLRKAPGSWQRSFDPEISEWGNPALHRWLSACSMRREIPRKWWGKRESCVKGHPILNT